jgi:hypothetical protein
VRVAQEGGSATRGGGGAPSRVCEAAAARLRTTLGEDAARRRRAPPLAADLRRTEFLRPECLLPVSAVADRLGVSVSTVQRSRAAEGLVSPARPALHSWRTQRSRATSGRATALADAVAPSPSRRRRYHLGRMNPPVRIQAESLGDPPRPRTLLESRHAGRQACAALRGQRRAQQVGRLAEPARQRDPRDTREDEAHADERPDEPRPWPSQSGPGGPAASPPSAACRRRRQSSRATSAPATAQWPRRHASAAWTSPRRCPRLRSGRPSTRKGLRAPSPRRAAP